MSEWIDPTKGHVNQLSNSMTALGQAITAQGIGLSEKLDTASALLAKAVKDASDTSERYAKSLANATWALVAATGVLVVVTAVNVYILMR